MRPNKLLDTIKFYFIGNMAIKILQFLFIPIYSSYIAIDDFGYYNLVVSVLSLAVPILYQSIWDGMLRFLIAEKDRENVVISTATVYCMLLSIIYIIIFVVVTPRLGIQFGTLILLMGLCQALASYWQYSARALKFNDVYVISAVVNSTIAIILNILLIVVFKMGLYGLFIANIVGNFVMFLILEFKMKLLSMVSTKNIDKILLKKILVYSFPLCINSVSWWLLISCNSLTISYKIGISANGIYSMANRFGTVMSLLTSVVNMAWQEESFRTYGEEGGDDYFNNVFEILYTVIFSAIIILIPVTYAAYGIMVYGDYKDGVIFTPFIYLTAGFSAFASHFASAFLARQKSKVVLYTTLIGGVFSAVGGFLAVKNFGIMGVVVTSLLGSIITYIIRIPFLKYHVKVKIDNVKFWLLFGGANVSFIVSNIFLGQFWLQVGLVVVSSVIVIVLNRKLIRQILSKIIKKIKYV